MVKSCSRIFDSLFSYNKDMSEDQENSLYALEVYMGDPVDFGNSAMFINNTSVPDKILSYDLICETIKDAKAIGVKVIVFSGQEAANFPKMQEILSFAKDLGIETDILNEKYFCNANSKNNAPALCMRHRYSVVITSYGYVLPCPGFQIPLGNIYYQKIGDIIKDSEILCDLKDYKNKIKGPCRICEKAKICYGCRGRSYIMTGDYLASDPLCERNENKRNDIISLPLKLDKIIPQMPPMRIIDSIDKLAERSAECTALIKDKMPFAQKDGSMDSVAYLEMMAQSIAALNGFRNMEESDLAPEGYLLGAKKLIINSKAKVGDRLSIYVFKYAKFGGFGIVKGIIKRDNEVLAFGEIKIWHNMDQE